MYDHNVNLSFNPLSSRRFWIESFKCFKCVLFSCSLSFSNSFVMGISLTLSLAYFAKSGKLARDAYLGILRPILPAIVKPGQYSI